MVFNLRRDGLVLIVGFDETFDSPVIALGAAGGKINFLRLFGVFYAAFPSKDCKRQKTRRIRNPVFRAQEKGVSRKSKSLSRFGFPKAGRRNVTGCKESPRIFKNDRMKLQNLTGRRRV